MVLKDSSWGKKKPTTNQKPNAKLKNILQDLSKLKKLGFTFILKFTENAKPQVKVGGGYVSLEVFLRYILDKINKKMASKSPNNISEAVDPEMVDRLNDYLTEMNNTSLQKAANNRRESFQGRWNPMEKGMIMSPRGNFMKAIVEQENKESANNKSTRSCKGSMSPALASKRSLHLTEDFSINVMESKFNSGGKH
jgi:hypothetical protein